MLDMKLKEISFREVLPLKEAFEKESLKLRKTRATIWLGAYCEGKLAGVCAFRRTKYGIKCKSDLVLKEFRGRGVYRRLFEERLKRVRSMDAEKLYAYCNTNSRPMYETYGFKRKGRLKRYTYMERKHP